MVIEQILVEKLQFIYLYKFLGGEKFLGKDVLLGKVREHFRNALWFERNKES